MVVCACAVHGAWYMCNGCVHVWRERGRKKKKKYIYELSGFCINVSNRKRLGTVSVVAVQIDGDIDVDDVPIFEGPAVRDAVAKHFIH